ncbi:MAG: alpha/beta fold hydrolase [Parvibaculum sp.]|nr:alpha/beta fold hydrolase [Parvibaculum sp.]
MAVLKALGAITTAIILIGLMSYWAAGRARPAINAETRAALAKENLAYKFIDLPDGTVHYRLEGPADAPLIVLVHGFSVASFVWNDYFEPLTRAGYRVLSYDTYGRGFSDRPSGPYDADLMDRQLANLLNELAPDTPVDLVGYSMGGAAVTIFASRHPAQVRSLTLIAPAGLGVASNRNIAILRRPLIGDWIVRMFGLKIFHDVAAEEAKAAPNPARFLADFDRQMDYSGFGEALLSTMRHYPLGSSEKAYAQAGLSSRPVMVLWGEADTTVPFSNAKKLMELMPNAKLYSYDKIGHSVAFGQSSLVTRHLIDFLASHPDAKDGAITPDIRIKTRQTIPAK